jgi:Uma2 family endonuclease
MPYAAIFINNYTLLYLRNEVLSRQLSSGEALTECSVLTEIGVRVPDVARASNDFLSAHGDSTPFPRAPEICVEITSPSDSDDEIREQTQAYLAAGAIEVWIVSEDGVIQYHDRGGKQAQSSFKLSISLPNFGRS